METIWWKTRVTSTRTIEMMRFLRAYWGRQPGGAPGREYSLSQALLRSVEGAYSDVLARLTKSADYRAEDNKQAKEAAAWWLKMARDGRNGDPFPGVSYGEPSPPAYVNGNDPQGPETLAPNGYPRGLFNSAGKG